MAAAALELTTLSTGADTETEKLVCTIDTGMSRI